MVEQAESRALDEQQGPIKYGRLRTEEETTLLLLTSMRTEDVIVDVTRTPGDFYVDAPIDTDPAELSRFPLRTVPPGFNYVVLAFPQDPETHSRFWEDYNNLKQAFAKNAHNTAENI